MDFNSGVDSMRLTICPACGYPRLGPGLCAACMPNAAAMPFTAVAGVPDQNPAA
jgi:hypothetical protein